MADLTATLPEQNFNPSPIGGARQGNIFQGLAEGASDIIQGIGQKQSSTGSGKKDNPVLDEYHMRIFEQYTGLKLGDPGYDQIKFAQRITKAKNSGNMSETMADVRIQAAVADLLRQHPDQAQEIMTEAYQSGKVDHYLFRDAYESNSRQDAAVEQNIKAEGALIDAAIESGQYNPKQPRELGLAIGLRYKADQAQMAADKAAVENQYKLWSMGNTESEANIKELQSGMQRRVLAMGNGVLNNALEQAGNIWLSAVDDPSRESALKDMWRTVNMGIDTLDSNGKAFMSSFERSYTDANGATHTIGFDEGNRNEWNNWVTQAKAKIKSLQDLKPDELKRVLESNKANAQVSMWQKFPTEMTMVEGLFGGSWQMFNDVTANPEKYGLSSAQTDQLTRSFAQGIDKYVKTSGQAIADATNAKALPSSNPDVAVSTAAFMQNNTIATLMGAKLMKGEFSGPGEQAHVLKSYENAYEDVVYAIRNNYTPNSIDIQKTAKALETVFNGSNIGSMSFYRKQGGSPDMANLFFQQSAIGASTFLEGLKSRYQIEFSEATGDFVAKQRPMTNVEKGMFLRGANGLYGLNGQEPGKTPYNNIPWEDRKAASQANALLGYIEQIQQVYPIISDELLKASGTNLRALVGSKGGFDKAIQAASEMAKQGLKAKSDKAFNDAVDTFKFDTNPFLGAQLGDRKPGGENPLASPDAWDAYLTGLRQDESGGNNNAKAKDSTALGPDQFTKDTWLEFAQDEPWAQGKSRDEILAMRTDPAKSEQVLKQFTAYNNNYLQEHLDRNILPEDLRVAHFLGADETVKVLTANPGLTIDKVVKAARGIDERATNFRMFYKGTDKEGKPIPRTVEEFLQMFGA